MGLKKEKILGISITMSQKKEILEYIKKYLKLSNYPILKLSNKRQKPLIIVTPNPEQIVYARQDPRFAEILNQADIAIPDGIGISLAVKFLNIKYQISNIKYGIQRIPGVELMGDLAKIAAEKGFSIALIGGRGGVAVRALECLQDQHPGLKGWAQDGPEIKIKNQKSKIKNIPCQNLFGSGQAPQKSKRAIQQFNNLTIEQSGKDAAGEYIKGIAEKIQTTNTRMVFVGLGAPKQEFFIEALKNQLSAIRQSESRKLKADSSVVLMSVGGSFDIISGKTPRAPHAIQAIHLEWLWRLISEPWRWRRQLALIKFFWMILQKRY